MQNRAEEDNEVYPGLGEVCDRYRAGTRGWKRIVVTVGEKLARVPCPTREELRPKMVAMITIGLAGPALFNSA